MWWNPPKTFSSATIFCVHQWWSKKKKKKKRTIEVLDDESVSSPVISNVISRLREWIFSNNPLMRLSGLECEDKERLHSPLVISANTYPEVSSPWIPSWLHGCHWTVTLHMHTIRPSRRRLQPWFPLFSADGGDYTPLILSYLRTFYPTWMSLSFFFFFFNCGVRRHKITPVCHLDLYRAGAAAGARPPGFCTKRQE